MYWRKLLRRICIGLVTNTSIYYCLSRWTKIIEFCDAACSGNLNLFLIVLFAISITPFLIAYEKFGELLFVFPTREILIGKTVMSINDNTVKDFQYFKSLSCDLFVTPKSGHVNCYDKFVKRSPCTFDGCSKGVVYFGTRQANEDLNNTSEKSNAKRRANNVKMAACARDPDLHQYIIDRNGRGYPQEIKNPNT